MFNDVNRFRVDGDSKVDLDKWPTDNDGGLTREAAEAEFGKLHERLIDLHELMYADGRFGLLVVFQAMDTGGKDSTIRGVFSGMSLTGVRALNFKAPNDTERKHDFLWRVHARVPPRGEISVFNRSHYEDVLIARVKSLAPSHRLKSRYEHINAFEELLHDEGTRVVKFYLHISKAYQKERLMRRLTDPKKQWKFNPDDVAERGRWKEYREAYELALGKCSTKHAPWYVVPAEKHWFRNLLVTKVLVEALESLELTYPKPTFDPKSIVIE